MGVTGKKDRKRGSREELAIIEFKEVTTPGRRPRECPRTCAVNTPLVLECEDAYNMDVVQLAACLKHLKNILIVDLDFEEDMCSCILLDFVRELAESEVVIITSENCGLNLITSCDIYLPDDVLDMRDPDVVAGLVIDQQDPNMRRVVEEHIHRMWHRVNSLEAGDIKNDYRTVLQDATKSQLMLADEFEVPNYDRILPFMKFTKGIKSPLFDNSGWYDIHDKKIDAKKYKGDLLERVAWTALTTPKSIPVAVRTEAPIIIRPEIPKTVAASPIPEPVVASPRNTDLRMQVALNTGQNTDKIAPMPPAPTYQSNANLLAILGAAFFAVAAVMACVLIWTCRKSRSKSVPGLEYGLPRRTSKADEFLRKLSTHRQRQVYSTSHPDTRLEDETLRLLEGLANRQESGSVPGRIVTSRVQLDNADQRSLQDMWLQQDLAKRSSSTQNRPRTMAEIQEQVRREIEEGNRPRGLSQQAELYMPSTSRSSDWPNDHRADPMVAMAQSERVAEAEMRRTSSRVRPEPNRDWRTGSQILPVPSEPNRDWRTGSQILPVPSEPNRDWRTGGQVQQVPSEPKVISSMSGPSSQYYTASMGNSAADPLSRSSASQQVELEVSEPWLVDPTTAWVEYSTRPEPEYAHSLVLDDQPDIPKVQLILEEQEELQEEPFGSHFKRHRSSVVSRSESLPIDVEKERDSDSSKTSTSEQSAGADASEGPEQSAGADASEGPEQSAGADASEEKAEKGDKKKDKKDKKKKDKEKGDKKDKGDEGDTGDKKEGKEDKKKDKKDKKEGKEDKKKDKKDKKEGKEDKKEDKGDKKEGKEDKKKDKKDKKEDKGDKKEDKGDKKKDKKDKKEDKGDKKKDKKDKNEDKGGKKEDKGGKKEDEKDKKDKKGGKGGKKDDKADKKKKKRKSNTNQSAYEYENDNQSALPGKQDFQSFFKPENEIQTDLKAEGWVYTTEGESQTTKENENESQNTLEPDGECQTTLEIIDESLATLQTEDQSRITMENEDKRQMTLITEGENQTTSEIEDQDQTTFETEEESQTTLETEDEGQMTLNTEGENQTTSETEDQDQTSSETEDESQTTLETEDESQASLETEDESQASLETEDESQASLETEDESQASLETEDDSQASLETEDESQASLETEDESQASLETEDESQASLETEDESQASLETEDESQATVETEDESQTTSDSEDESQTASESEYESLRTSVTEDKSKYTLETEDDYKTISDTEDESQNTLQTEDESQTTLETENESQSTVETEDESQTALETDDESQSTLETEDESQTVLETEDESQNSLETIDEYQSNYETDYQTQSTPDSKYQTQSTYESEEQSRNVIKRNCQTKNKYESKKQTQRTYKIKHKTSCNETENESYIAYDTENVTQSTYRTAEESQLEKGTECAETYTSMTTEMSAIPEDTSIVKCSYTEDIKHCRPYFEAKKVRASASGPPELQMYREKCKLRLCSKSLSPTDSRQDVARVHRQVKSDSFHSDKKRRRRISMTKVEANFEQLFHVFDNNTCSRNLQKSSSLFAKDVVFDSIQNKITQYFKATSAFLPKPTLRSRTEPLVDINQMFTNTDSMDNHKADLTATPCIQELNQHQGSDVPGVLVDGPSVKKEIKRPVPKPRTLFAPLQVKAKPAETLAEAKDSENDGKIATKGVDLEQMLEDGKKEEGSATLTRKEIETQEPTADFYTLPSSEALDLSRFSSSSRQRPTAANRTKRGWDEAPVAETWTLQKQVSPYLYSSRDRQPSHGYIPSSSTNNVNSMTSSSRYDSDTNLVCCDSSSTLECCEVTYDTHSCSSSDHSDKMDSKIFTVHFTVCPTVHLTGSTGRSCDPQGIDGSCISEKIQASAKVSRSLRKIEASSRRERTDLSQQQTSFVEESSNTSCALSRWQKGLSVPRQVLHFGGQEQRAGYKDSQSSAALDTKKWVESRSDLEMDQHQDVPSVSSQISVGSKKWTSSTVWRRPQDSPHQLASLSSTHPNPARSFVSYVSSHWPPEAPLTFSYSECTTGASSAPNSLSNFAPGLSLEDSKEKKLIHDNKSQSLESPCSFSTAEVRMACEDTVDRDLLCATSQSYSSILDEVNSELEFHMVHGTFQNQQRAEFHSSAHSICRTFAGSVNTSPNHSQNAQATPSARTRPFVDSTFEYLDPLSFMPCTAVVLPNTSSDKS